MPLWIWLGLIGSLGCTINYFVTLLFYSKSTDQHKNTQANYENFYDKKNKLKYIFRELFRSDFCFIVIILTIFDMAWILLPTAAIGSHVYWIIYFVKDET